MTGCFTDPIGGVPDAEWDRLAAGRFYSSALWLRLCGLAPGALSGGICVDTPGGGRAAVPVAAVTDESNPHLRWTDLLTGRGLRAPAPQGILVGQRRGYLAHLLGSAGTDPTTVAHGLLDAIRAVQPPGADERSDRQPDARVAMYLTTPDVLALRDAGVQTMPVALKTDAWIEIPPGGWDAWLDSLSSHRARRIRSEVRRFDRVGYKVEHRTLSESYQDVARLMARTEERYGRTIDVAGLAESFRRQGELAGPHAEVLLCSLDGAPPVGFCLYYHWGDTIYLRGIGWDYEQLNDAAEYFNLTYYLPARTPGVRWLHAGTETPDGKALRGATLRPLWLLDLSADSVLTGQDTEIRAHNRALLDRLRDTSPAVATALEEPLWAPYC